MLRKYTSNSRDALVLGIDMNFSMVALAQKIIREKRFEYAKRSIGMTYKWHSIDVSFEHMQQVDFGLPMPCAYPLRIEVSIMWLVVMF